MAHYFSTALFQLRINNNFSFFLSFSPLSPSGDSKERILRGVMRVGLVAKGLILKEDKDLQLVLLCSNKPTNTLLKEVAQRLYVKLKVEINLQLTVKINVFDGILKTYFSC